MKCEFENKNYRLRASQPVAQLSCPAQGNVRSFVLQTFGVERRSVKVYKVTDHLLLTTDFVGNNIDGNFEGASYQGSNYVDSQGNLIVTGNTISIPTYMDEDTYQFQQ